MDSARLDALARLVTHAPSRRQTLRLLAVGAGGLLATRGGSGANAQPGCRGAGNPCEGNQQCCAGLVCAASGPGTSRRCTLPPTRTPTPPLTPTPTPTP